MPKLQTPTMAIADDRPPTVSLEQYRQQEQTAEFRSEYRNGEIVPMTGASINHNRIVRNLISLLYPISLDKNFEVFPSDLRIWIPQHRKGTYPDVFVIAGEPIFNDRRTDEVLNPCLIIEVLSKSTENYDRGNKFLSYRSIETLQEYLLVSQSACFLERYVKTDDRRWLLEEYRESQDSIVLESVGASLAIADIYRGVDFAIAES